MELIRESPVERMTFPDGNWVDLRMRLTIAERKRLAAAAFGMAAEDDGSGSGRQTIRPTADLAAVEMAALNIGIVAWSLEEPLTPENVALLDEETGFAIKERLDALWKTRRDDERKNSSGGGARPSGAVPEGGSPRNWDG